MIAQRVMMVAFLIVVHAQWYGSVFRSGDLERAVVFDAIILAIALLIFLRRFRSSIVELASTKGVAVQGSDGKPVTPSSRLLATLIVLSAGFTLLIGWTTVPNQVVADSLRIAPTAESTLLLGPVRFRISERDLQRMFPESETATARLISHFGSTSATLISECPGAMLEGDISCGDGGTVGVGELDPRVRLYLSPEVVHVDLKTTQPAFDEDDPDQWIIIRKDGGVLSTSTVFRELSLVQAPPPGMIRAGEDWIVGAREAEAREGLVRGVIVVVFVMAVLFAIFASNPPRIEGDGSVYPRRVVRTMVVQCSFWCVLGAGISVGLLAPASSALSGRPHVLLLALMVVPLAVAVHVGLQPKISEPSASGAVPTSVKPFR